MDKKAKAEAKRERREEKKKRANEPPPLVVYGSTDTDESDPETEAGLPPEAESL